MALTAGEPIKIFISSTFTDLRRVRDRIIQFARALGTAPLSMEAFGSDARAPKDVCLANVRLSNYLILIIGTRYGSIDNASGKSITQLEYEEALAARVPVFVYLIDSEAKVDAKEIFAEGEQHRALLKKFRAALLAHHTVDNFRNYDDLLFKITRDIYQKIVVPSFRLTPPGLAWLNTVSPRVGPRPAAMDFYREKDREHFKGREAVIESAVLLAQRNRVALLIGASGVGKTSLIHAGILPCLRAEEWRFVYARPLDALEQNVAYAMYDQLAPLERIKSPDLAATLAVVANVHSDAQILLIVDQFEEALNERARAEMDAFVRVLAAVQLGSPPNIHVLLAYRGDAESLLGQLWQRIAGDAHGLPRLYLEPLAHNGTMDALRDIIVSEGMAIENSTLMVVTDAIAVESAQYLQVRGVYPPYVQIVGAALVKAAREADSNSINEALYDDLGGAGKIIGEYLFERISELGSARTDGERVLRAMVKSSGRRSTLALAEIVRHSELNEDRAREILDLLTGRRLVRSTGEEEYEVVHDYLSELIRSKLFRSSDDELRTKQAFELLALRADGEGDLGDWLDPDELIAIYRHRQRLVPSENQLEVLVASGLACEGPFWYWLRDDRERWLRAVDKLRSKDTPRHRVLAYRALWCALGPAAFLKLTDGLADGDGSIRKEVVTLIAASGADGCLDVIERCFADPKQEVVEAALGAAAQILLDRSLPLANNEVLRRIVLGSEEIKMFALCKHYGERMSGILMSLLREDENVIPFLLMTTKGDAPEDLAALAQSARGKVRENAIKALAAFGETRALATLYPNMGRTSSEMRKEFVDALAAACLRARAPGLFQTQRLGRLDLDKVAIRALVGELGPDSLPLLVETLREDEEGIFEVARLGDEETLRELLGLFAERLTAGRRSSLLNPGGHYLEAAQLLALKLKAPFVFEGLSFGVEAGATFFGSNET